MQETIVRKTKKRASQLQEEILRYQQFKIKLFESLTEGLINKREYLELQAYYDLRMKEARTAEDRLLQDRDAVLDSGSHQVARIQAPSDLWNTEKPHRRLLTTLIEKIVVYEDRRMELFLL